MRDSIAAGAVIERGRILLCHRSSDRQWYPNVWDLPGGHIEPGETSAEALTRELLEELGLLVHSLAQYPLTRLSTVAFEMDIWLVTGWNGTPANLAPTEHDAVAWFSGEELTGLQMAHGSYLTLLQALLKS